MSDKGYTTRQGPIEAAFNRWAAERTTAVSTAVGQMRRAQAKEIEAETERTDQFTKLDEAHNRRASVSARFHNERELDRAQSAEKIRAAWRVYEANEVAHQTDLTNRYTGLTIARTTFVDAQRNYTEATQQLAAIKKYGPGFHEIEMILRAAEKLGITFDGPASRVLFERHVGALPAPAQQALPPPDYDKLVALVAQHRQNLLDSNMPTDEVDAVLAKTNKR